MPAKPEMKPLGEIADSIRAEIVSRKEGESYRYKTGLAELDDIIIAIRKKRLYVVGGRPGEGKTSLMCQFAFELADKHARVLYISLEMSKEEIVQRMICKNQGVDYHFFELDKLDTKLEENLKKFKELVKEFGFLVIDAFGYRFDILSEFIQKLNPVPDVIFIDHIQMISAQGFRSKYEAVSEYVRKLKELAQTLNIAIVIASQINRDGAGGKPQLSQLKSAGTIEEVADVVLLCYWPFNSNEKERKREEYEIYVAKNRFGKVKSINLNFKPEIYEFSNKKKGYHYAN